MKTKQEMILIMKALSDENRLTIFDILKKKDAMCACDILDELKITQPTLSHHMKILCEAGLVDVKKDGKWSYYSINADVCKRVKSSFFTLFDCCENETK